MALNQEAQNFIAELVTQLSPAVQQMVQSGCQTYLARSGVGVASPLATSAANALPPANGGSYPVPGANGGQYPQCAPGFSPFSSIPGCPVVCDPCLSAYLEGDLELFAWPLIEAQLYSTFTPLNVVLAPGAFPLAPGTSITLEQAANRTITYLPDCVAITPTWSGGPAQDGLVTYQWAVAQKGTATQVLFGEPMNGSQFKCGDECEKQPFPEWRGCSSLPIPPLASLRLIVTLDAAATSVLESVSVIVYHRRSKKKSCCGGCASGGSCSC